MSYIFYCSFVYSTIFTQYWDHFQSPCVHWFLNTVFALSSSSLFTEKYIWGIPGCFDQAVTFRQAELKNFKWIDNSPHATTISTFTIREIFKFFFLIWCVFLLWSFIIYLTEKKSVSHILVETAWNPSYIYIYISPTDSRECSLTEKEIILKKWHVS